MIALALSTIFVIQFYAPTHREGINGAEFDMNKEGSHFNIYVDDEKLKRTVPKWTTDDGKVLTIVDIKGVQKVKFTAIDKGPRESLYSDELTLDELQPRAPILCK